jgi:hypothetical protein
LLSFKTVRAHGVPNLAKSAELAFSGRNKNREWGAGLGLKAQATMIDFIGMSIIPMYM